ncbi:MAG: hypothetical protein KA116_00590 [Proteobacteria bacterium]|nr:hypothetical protein [Pseudomonadota bacterium]
MFKSSLARKVLLLSFLLSACLSLRAEDSSPSAPEKITSIGNAGDCSLKLLEKTAAALGLSPKIEAPVLVGEGAVALLNPGQVEAFATYTRLEKIYNSYLLPLAIFLEFSDRRYILSKDIVVRKISLLNDVTSDFQKEQIARRIAIRLLLLFRDDFSVDDYKAFERAAYSLNLSLEQFKEVFKSWKNEGQEDPDLTKLSQMIKFLITYESKLFIARIRALSTSQILAHSFREKTQAEIIDKAIAPMGMTQSLSGLNVKFRHLKWALKKSHSLRLQNYVLPRVKSKLSEREAAKLGLSQSILGAKAFTAGFEFYEIDSNSGAPSENLEAILVTLRTSKDSPIILYRNFKKILDPEKFKITLIEFKVFLEKLFEDRLYHSLAAPDFTDRMKSQYKRADSESERGFWSGENTKLQLLVAELALRCLSDNLDVEFVDALKALVSRKIVNNLMSYSYKEAYVVDVSDYLELILDSKKKGATILPLIENAPKLTEPAQSDRESSENQDPSSKSETTAPAHRSDFGPG